jgi:hypothetical protein
MNARKIHLVTLVTLVAAALAVPASASANHMFVHNNAEGKHVKLEGEPEVTVSGNLRFSDGIGAYECSVTSQVKLRTEEALMTSLVYNLNDCVGEGDLEGCVLLSAAPASEEENLSPANPWTVDIRPQNTALNITGMEIYFGFDEETCIVPEIILTAEVMATPNNTNAITALGLSEIAAVTHVGAFELPASVNGSLIVEPIKTYGIT